MVGSDRRTALALAALSLALACGGAPRPEPLPPQAVTQHRPEPAEPIPPAATPVPTPKAETVIVIEPPADSESRPLTLGEAAQRERERRQAGVKPPVAVITNKNLAEFAKDQKLTVASPEPADSGEGDAAAAVSAEEAAQREEYWRQRGLDIRQRWRDAVDAVARLQQESADLRQQFYSTDDPYVRDGQIKPDWDRVLAELDRARREAAAAPGELADFFEEARQAGALPGWLEDGSELEPEPPPDETTRRVPEADIGEPPIVEEDPGDP